MLDNSYTSIFKFFLAVSKIVKEISSWDTYGSFRQDFLTDKKGKLIKTDKVFLNIYDYWGLIHAPRSIRVERWYHPKVAFLKKHLRKKWKKESFCKRCPLLTLCFKKLRKKNLFSIRFHTLKTRNSISVT